MRNIHWKPTRPPTPSISWKPAETSPTTAADTWAAVKYMPMRRPVLEGG